MLKSKMWLIRVIALRMKKYHLQKVWTIHNESF